MAAKPQINLDFTDPFFTPTALHFDNLFQRYGSPLIVLNLVKSHEKNRRESILLESLTEAVAYLNQSLPEKHKIQYIAWDMARASKSADQEVIVTLENIAENVLKQTGFFHTRPEPIMNTIRRRYGNKEQYEEQGNQSMYCLQSGIVRTNCIDCIDRTNAAQFIMGKCALGYQLYTLGIIPKPIIGFDCDAVNLLNAMYHDHGDTIALQYGGSHLVNTMETYRKISKWTSHSRDMIESIRRYYSNSFTDVEKQAAMNLFLGVYVPWIPNQLPLWDLTTDFYLHNSPYKLIKVDSYINWFTPEYLEKPSCPPVGFDLVTGVYETYYQPSIYTILSDLFEHKLISTNANASDSESPFLEIRVNPLQTTRYLMIYSLNIGGVKRWLAFKSNQLDDEKKSDVKLKIVTAVKCSEQSQIRNIGWDMKPFEPDISPTELREYKR